MSQLCPCGLNKAVADCCESIISGKRNAATAEELMRSRYVAFTKADVNYLMQSHHSKTRPIKEKKSIEHWAKSVQWVGLTILSTTEGKETDNRGMVEFRALYIEEGELREIHEKSLFEREGGKWVYTSGIHY